MIRLLALVLFACGLIAADYPDPPPVLEPYFEDGEFDPVDYGWLRGDFPGATETEKAASVQVNDWVNACFEAGKKKAVAALAERGVMVVDPWRLGTAPAACTLVSTQPADLSPFADFEQFGDVLASTRRIVDAFTFAAQSAESTLAREEGLAAQIRRRVLRDQILRHAMDWVFRPDPDSPHLDEAQKPIFMALLGQEVARVDAANTAWLKDVVAQYGWPTVSMVGEQASGQAWLLVQHADRDPVFQLDALRLMEPLVAQKEISPRDYAYLYDRIMLKLTGKQRYATQMSCQNGRMEPQPLENAERISEWRAAMQLETLDDYRKLFPETC